MTEELKARIAQINAGTAPAGYKKTKVGIVPEEWEVSEIGKQLVEYRELSNDIEQYPVYSSSRKGLMPQSDYYDKKDAVQTNLGYKMVPVGYATYRHMSDDDIFHFNINSTEDTILVSCEYPVFTAKPTANQYFIITSLNETARFRYFCRTQKLGGTRTRLYFSNLSKYRLALPPLPEQQKIAEILTTQDEVIALMQKQIELLQKQKKAFLQKMFPKKGCTVPEIRFAGFTDAWEQRKLGERMYIKSRVGWQALTKNEYMTTGDYYLITGTDIDPNHTVDLSRSYYVSKERYEMDTNIQVKNGDIIITKDGTIGKVAMISGLDKPATLNSHLFVLRDESGELDNNFFLQLLCSHIFEQFVESVKTGSTLTGLPQKTIVEFKFLYPSLEEQQKIGAYFSRLDNLITLHQRKVEIEQQKKKALMQLLLTGKVRCV